MADRIYVVYDERAMNDTDDAVIYVAGATSLKEAREDARGFAPCVIYSYRAGKFGKNGGQELEDERFEEHVS